MSIGLIGPPSCNRSLHPTNKIAMASELQAPLIEPPENVDQCDHLAVSAGTTEADLDHYKSFAPTTPDSPAASNSPFNDKVLVGSMLWFALLIGQYVLGRLWCVYASLPSDGEPTFDAFDLAVNLQAMVIYGFTLGYAVGAFDPVHLEWLCTKTHCVILVLGTAVSVPCFSLISDAATSGGAGFTASGSSQVSAGGVAVIAVTAVLAFGAVGWHLVFYWREQRTQFWAYIVARAALAILYGICCGLVKFYGGDVHLHHWFFGWYFGMFFNVRHNFSLLALAVCLGIFVQGISAYNAAPLWTRDTCWSWVTPFEIRNARHSPSNPEQFMKTGAAGVCQTKDPSIDRVWKMCYDRAGDHNIECILNSTHRFNSTR